MPDVTVNHAPLAVQRHNSAFFFYFSVTRSRYLPYSLVDCDLQSKGALLVFLKIYIIQSVVVYLFLLNFLLTQKSRPLTHTIYIYLFFFLLTDNRRQEPKFPRYFFLLPFSISIDLGEKKN